MVCVSICVSPDSGGLDADGRVSCVSGSSGYLGSQKDLNGGNENIHAQEGGY